MEKRKVGVSVSEWVCRRHGFQPPPKAGKGKPTCKWCGNELTLNTWVMSGEPKAAGVRGRR